MIRHPSTTVRHCTTILNCSKQHVYLELDMDYSRLDSVWEQVHVSLNLWEEYAAGINQGRCHCKHGRLHMWHLWHTQSTCTQNGFSSPGRPHSRVKTSKNVPTFLAIKAASSWLNISMSETSAILWHLARSGGVGVRAGPGTHNCYFFVPCLFKICTPFHFRSCHGSYWIYTMYLPISSGFRYWDWGNC